MVLKRMIKKRVARAAAYPGGDVGLEDIDAARKVLFAVFSRYGDGILSFAVIRDFITARPDKDYLIITSNQLRPYAERILRGDRADVDSISTGSTGSIHIESVNKRKNPVKLLKLTNRLKKSAYDIGFNPFSLGDDSEYFLSFATKSALYRKFPSHEINKNLYARVREYLLLPEPDDVVVEPELKEVRTVVIAPDSSNPAKSLDRAVLGRVVELATSRFPDAAIAVATDDSSPLGLPRGVETFVFGKSNARSRAFLKLMEMTDLFIGVDAGPLHLALALGVPSIAIFGPTPPEIILNRGNIVSSLRDAGLAGVYCYIESCKEPLCIHGLFEKTGEKTGDEGSLLDGKVAVDLEKNIKIEREACLAKGAKKDI